MKTCTKCKNELPIESFRPRGDRKTGLRAECKTCQNLRTTVYRQQWSAEKMKERNRKSYLKQRSEWTPEKRQAKLAACKEWRANNPSKGTEYRARYRARQAQATPKWADKAAIAQIYQLAAQQRLATGEHFHVDHIVPLKSDLVCGLHTANNLQIVGKNYNQSKTNRTWPDMP